MALCALTTPEKSTHTPPAFLETAVILHGMCHYSTVYYHTVYYNSYIYQTLFFLLKCTLPP